MYAKALSTAIMAGLHDRRSFRAIDSGTLAARQNAATPEELRLY
jgi:hypothetical protein